MIACVSIRSSSWLEILTFKSDPKDDKGCHQVEWNTLEKQSRMRTNNRCQPGELETRMVRKRLNKAADMIQM